MVQTLCENATYVAFSNFGLNAVFNSMMKVQPESILNPWLTMPVMSRLFFSSSLAYLNPGKIWPGGVPPLPLF